MAGKSTTVYGARQKNRAGARKRHGDGALFASGAGVGYGAATLNPVLLGAGAGLFVLGSALRSDGVKKIARASAIDGLVARSRGQSAGLAMAGATYQRTYTTGPKAGTTETVRKPVK